MIEEKIFTENPEEELWRELLHFTYKANVKRFLEERSLCCDDSVINCVIGSFLQANEYYKACAAANLQISPLLLYYGTTNLLYGMVTLINGEVKEIHNHGMRLSSTSFEKYIAETEVSFENPETGGLHVFSKALGYNDDLSKMGRWNLKEFLSSIAEIENDFKRCYQEKNSNVLKVDVVNTVTGKIEKINYSKVTENEILDVLQNVTDIEKSYFPPQKGKDPSGQEYYILRRKMTGEDIKYTSFSGQPYLLAGVKKNGKQVTLPPLLNLYIALFMMGSLCRYQPQLWSPFVLNDETGERLVYEKVIHYARRLIPNMVLNEIHQKKITYVTEKYNEKDTIKLVNEHEVKEIVKEELFKQKRKEQLKR